MAWHIWRLRRQQRREPLPLLLTPLQRQLVTETMHSLIGSVVVVREQHRPDHDVHRLSVSEPDRRLLWALLEDSRLTIKDAASQIRRLGRVVSRDKSGRQLRRNHLDTELDWLLGHHGPMPGFVSFGYCCEMLGLRESAVREAILAPLLDVLDEVPEQDGELRGATMRNRGRAAPSQADNEAIVRNIVARARLRNAEGEGGCGDTGTIAGSLT